MPLRKYQLPDRFLTLDMMRGYFIVVIIINHLWRWPNAFAAISGANQLWFSGAEGFVMLSGLLIGYVRGHKNRALPFEAVTKKLFVRAGLLYVWFVVATIALTAIAWNSTFIAPTAWISIDHNNYPLLIHDTVMLLFAHNWVHFLWLYTVFLIAAPVFILLLRNSLTLLAAGLIGVCYYGGSVYKIEWMEWAPVFFMPLIVGYHLPKIAHWWHEYRHTTIIKYSLMIATVLILATSALSIFYLYPHPFFDSINHYLSKDGGFTIGRLAIASICFTGLYFLFDQGYRWLDQYFGWLLKPFGKWSLAVYTFHGVIISVFAMLFAESQNIIVNTAITLLAILLARIIVAIRPLQRFFPK